MKKIRFRLMLTALCLIVLTQTVWGAQLVVPGGQVIGLQLQDNTITVAAFDEDLGAEAKSCGLQIGDRIVAINGKTVCSAQDVRDVLSRTDGDAEISVLRDGKAKKLHITPEITSDGPRLGVYLKQGITGVGTVTWYDPDSGRFGALGHGVNDPTANWFLWNKERFITPQF